jgi:hypothetical protein
METMREQWTDERLDDLNAKVDRGFDRVDRRFERIEDDIEAMRIEINDRFSEINGRFDSMQRMTLGAYVTAVIGLIVTQL